MAKKRVGIRNGALVTSSSGIITDGLILNLDAGNTLSYPGTGANWFDLTSNDNDGVLLNGASYSTDGGGSISFDGVNDYVDMNSFGVGDDLSDYTFCVWSKNSNNGHVLTKGRDGNGNGWSLTIGTYNNQFGVGAVKSTSGTYGYILLGGTYQPNKWDYISGTWDSVNGIISLYINGLFIDSYTMPGTGPFTLSSSTTGWSSGRITNNAYPKGGQLSQIQIYNNALTESQIQQNYNATKGRFGL